MKARRRLLAIGGLVTSGIAVLVFGLLLVVQPQRDHLKAVRAQIDEAQTEIVSTQAVRGGSSGAGATQIFQLSRAMPFVDDMPGILLSLSRTATATSTALISVRPSVRIALPDGSSAVPLQVVLDGSYLGLERFLRDLRAAVRVGREDVVRTEGRLFLVDQVQITASSGTAGATGPQSEMSANLSLIAFDYGAPPATGSTAGLSAAPGAAASTDKSTSVSAAGPTTRALG